MDAKKNTVSAINQMVASSELSFLGNENAQTRILIVGNSITRHGPKADIGWDGDWGMAASAPEKDYVHRLYAKLTEDGQDVYMRIRQCAFWERNYRKEDILSNYADERDFAADIVIFRLGENILEEDLPYFKEALEKFISYICPLNGKTIFLTSFFKMDKLNEDIRLVAKQRGEVCLEACFSTDESNMALGQFWHEGVSIHPSDKGMEAIADVIFKEIRLKNIAKRKKQVL